MRNEFQNDNVIHHQFFCRHTAISTFTLAVAMNDVNYEMI